MLEDKFSSLLSMELTKPNAMSIITIQYEKEGKLYGQRFLKSAKGHCIRLTKQAVKHLVKHRLQMAHAANNVPETASQVVASLF